jgi:hypothetical protein
MAERDREAALFQGRSQDEQPQSVPAMSSTERLTGPAGPNIRDKAHIMCAWIPSRRLGL